MIKSAILEVYNIEPRLKHPTIFEHFDALNSGESFIIKNDHDPKPLYYQLLGERGNGFTWDYLESGPEIWQVRLAKPIADGESENIGIIAAKDIRKAERLKQLGIDFCCGGQQSVKDAAESVGLSEEDLRVQLNESVLQEIPSTKLDYQDWDIDFLSDYIKQVHHKYVREKGPIILELAKKVAMLHAGEHPSLVRLSEELEEFLSELYCHLEKEEKQLFPATKNLHELSSNQANQLIDFLRLEHEHAGDELRKLRKISKDYHLPANACNSHSSLFEQIKAFEADLFQHIHLENNILFPKMTKAYRVQIS